VDPVIEKSARFDNWTGTIGIPGLADSRWICRVLGDAVEGVRRFAQERNQDRKQRELIERSVREAFANVPEGIPLAEIPDTAVVKLSRLVAERFTNDLFQVDSDRDAPELLPKLQGK
jgi:hypothetical protein